MAEPKMQELLKSVLYSQNIKSINEVVDSNFGSRIQTDRRQLSRQQDKRLGISPQSVTDRRQEVSPLNKDDDAHLVLPLRKPQVWMEDSVLGTLPKMRRFTQAQLMSLKEDCAEAIKSEKNCETCEGCGYQINDRFLMRVGEASWHESCLECNVCRAPLDRICYCRNNKVFCKPDYDRLFGAKCSRCGERVHSHEMIMRAQSHIYHLHCFVCVMCCQTLQKGEQFVLSAGQLFCWQDYEKKMSLLQQSPTDDMLLDDTSRPRDGRRGPKRPRTILTSAQRRQFKAAFEISPKPCRKVREALAKETGLSVRVVQVWFQNQRAKVKKNQRKVKMELDKSNDKENKNDPTIKQESINSDHNNYLSLSSLRDGRIDTSFLSNTGQPLDPNHPFSSLDDCYQTHSGDSFCSSEEIYDENTNMDEVDSDSMSVPPRSEGSTHGVPASENPLDELYLMQNSYFNKSDQ